MSPLSASPPVSSYPFQQSPASFEYSTTNNPYFFFLRKVIQPHLPIRLPCYDFTPVIGSTFGSSSLAVRSLTSGISNSHGVTGGVYKTRTYSPRHADSRLLAIPASCSRVADYSPNWDVIFGIRSRSPSLASLCLRHCSTCVAQAVRGHDDLTSSPPSSGYRQSVQSAQPYLLATEHRVALVAGLNPTSHDTS